MSGTRAEGVKQIYERFGFRLYVTGATPLSTRSVANIRELCHTHLPGRFDLEVIDILQQPGLIEREQIIAAPTLIKYAPPPIPRYIGDLAGLEDPSNKTRDRHGIQTSYVA
jgi:circadian clock protein KaiB